MLTRRIALAGLTASLVSACANKVTGSTAAQIDANVDEGIADMNARLPFTREIAGRAVGMLMMPGIIKGGLIVGGAYGEGALRLPADGYRGSQGYYNFAAGSLGWQAGVQKTAHAIFFMTDAALDRFRTSDGWEVGADAEVTVLDTGIKAELNTTLAQRPVIAVIYSQQGLMAGASLEGAKYSRVKR